MAQTMNQANTIPANLAERGGLDKNLKFIIGGFLLIAIVISLIVYGTVTTGSYYLTVSELNSAGPEIVGERVRVNGNVVEGSENWNAQEITLRFSISDENGSQLPIVFYGPRPDNFQRAASAIVEGELLADGSFQANNLLLKCPSRYEEEPEEVYVESNR